VFFASVCVQCWQVLLSHSNVDADAEDANAGTRARNVLCDVDTRAEDRIADLGFPVLTMLAESPAVVNCVRYLPPLEINILGTATFPFH